MVARRRRTRKAAHDQTTQYRSPLLPVSLRPGPVGVCGRTLGRSRGRGRVPHGAARRLRRWHPARARRVHRLSLEGLDCVNSTRVSSGARGPHASESGRRSGAPEQSQERRDESRAAGEPGRQARGVLRAARAVRDRAVRGRCADRSRDQEARGPNEQRALRRDHLHLIVGCVVAGQCEVCVHRAVRGQSRDRDSRRELGQHRASGARAERRSDFEHRVVAGWADDRVFRTTGRVGGFVSDQHCRWHRASAHR